MEKTTIVGELLNSEAQIVKEKLEKEFPTFHFGIIDGRNGMCRVVVEEYVGNALFMNIHYFSKGVFSVISSQ